MPTKKFEILVLNQISQVGLKRFPEKGYKVSKDAAHPDAILVRSHDMNAMKVPECVRAIGRAGAGTNNIPVEALSGPGTLYVKLERRFGFFDEGGWLEVENPRRDDPSIS